MTQAPHRVATPPRPSHLAVLLAGEYVADLERTRTGSLRLTYLTGIGIAGTPVSLSLPRGIVHTGFPVERFVGALLPENPDALAAIARAHGVDRKDPLALLGAIGLDCPGAIQFCAEHDVDATLHRAGTLEPFTASDIEARLAQMEVNEAASWTMPHEHWSLGGTQQKFALRWESGAWHLAHGSEATSHIVKPGIRTLHSQALTEHVTMAAAAMLGLPTAATRYTEFKSQSALVVERFDRARIDGRLTRLHQEDICQALGIQEKYEDQGGPSAAQVLRVLTEAATSAADARASTAAFVDMLVFNTVVAAPDAHGRNFAIMLADERVTLAPMFDCATGLAHTTPGQRTVTMSIGGERRVDHITGDHWKRLAAELGLDEDYLLGRVGAIADAAPAAFAAAFLQTDHADATELAERLTAPLATTTSTFARSVTK